METPVQTTSTAKPQAKNKKLWMDELRKQQVEDHAFISGENKK